MAVHRGNAKQRLASECRKILLLPIEEVPNQFISEYKEMIRLIKTELSYYPRGLDINNFVGKRNSTVVKYIKLLIEIEYVLKD